jgi:hypothetical protein
LSEASASRLVTVGGANRYPIWSADSQWVSFQSDREGELGIWWQRADGSGAAERLTKPDKGVAQIPDSWSPVDQKFSFTAIKGMESSVWIFSLQDKKATLFAQMPSANLRWSAFPRTATGSPTNPTKREEIKSGCNPFPLPARSISLWLAVILSGHEIKRNFSLTLVQDKSRV